MAVRGTSEWRANISAARKLQIGENAPAWKGECAKPESIKVRGRRAARKLFAMPEHCEICGAELESRVGGWARHHIDGDTANNNRINILIVCQSCHMKIDNPQHSQEKRRRAMARVKYDVTDAEVRNFEVPKPGIYDAKIHEVTHGKSTSDNPMFTIVFEITRGDNKGSRIWHYILTDGSQEWRLREFTDALGLKPKGTLDTDDITGKVVKIKTAIDPAKDGYDEKARIKNVLASTNGASAESEEDGDEEPYSEWDITDLKEEVEARELEIAGKKTKKKLVEALEADDAESDDEDEEEEESDEEEGDDDEITRADLEEMSRTELKKLIQEEELEIKVMKKHSEDDLRAKIAEALELEDDEEEGDEDEEDEEEEDTDYSEWDISDLKKELKERGLKTDGRKSVLVKRLEKDDESDDEPF